MKKRIAWLVVSCLMVVALVLASCAPAVTEKEEKVKEEVAKEEVAKEEVAKEEVVKEEEAKEAVVKEEVVAPAAGEPKYGGVISLVFSSPPQAWDELTSPSAGKTENPNVHTVDHLFTIDRKRGPEGTNEFTGMARGLPPDNSLKVGLLAESWEVPDLETIRIHMRPELLEGKIRWHDKPPANGRAMTLDDVIYNLRRLYSLPTSYPARAYPMLADMENVENSIYAIDPLTIELKAKPESAAYVHDMVTLYVSMLSPDAIEKYGDFNDWKHVIGTGPFILTDYVPGSSITYERNPNYWRKDPLHPQNQLPYLDGIRIMIIEDLSTRLAALRTAKIDVLNLIEHDDADSLMQSNPELKWNKYPSMEGLWLYVRNDTPPFDDIRVRRAMMMAIDHEEIVRDFYDGDAVILNAPAPPIKEMEGFLVTLDELPEETRKMWEYHPDEAEQLLDEAGYPGPDRFTYSAVAWKDEHTDMLSIIADYWSRVGVTLTIDKKEYGVWRSMGRSRSFKQGYMTGHAGYIETLKYLNTRPGGPIAYACVPATDTLPTELYHASMANYFDIDARRQVIKGNLPEYLSRAYVMWLPGPYVYHMWWPWVGGYHGELSWPDSYYRWTRYVWIDQDLREEMTGRR